MSIHKLSIQSYYTQATALAAEYDHGYLKPERQENLRIVEDWLPDFFSKAKVLEVACGTGYWTQFIAPAAEHIVAIDTAPETIRMARKRITNSKVSFIDGDAYELEHDIGKFNAAFAGFWFSHIPKARRREFILGLNALLEPGSKVILIDNRYVEGSSSPLTQYDAHGNTYQTRILEDGTAHRILKNFPCASEFKSLMIDLGQQCKFTSWEYFWAFEYETPS